MIEIPNTAVLRVIHAGKMVTITITLALWHPVPGDAHVGAHVHPGHLPQLQHRAGHLLNYDTIV